MGPIPALKSKTQQRTERVKKKILLNLETNPADARGLAANQDGFEDREISRTENILFSDVLPVKPRSAFPFTIPK